MTTQQHLDQVQTDLETLRSVEDGIAALIAECQEEVVCPFCGDIAGIDEDDGSIICDFCQTLEWDED